MNTLPAAGEERQPIKEGLRFEWYIDERWYHGHDLGEYLTYAYICPEDAEKIIAEMRRLSRRIDEIGQHNKDQMTRAALRKLSDKLVQAHRHVHQFLPAAPTPDIWDIQGKTRWVLARILELMPPKPSWALI